MLRLAVLFALTLSSSMALADPAHTQDADPAARTGGMGVGTRPDDASARPGTDIPAAGAGAGAGKPGATPDATGSGDAGGANRR